MNAAFFMAMPIRLLKTAENINDKWFSRIYEKLPLKSSLGKNIL